MASHYRGVSHPLLLLAIFVSYCFSEFGTPAHLIPETEVNSLQIIADKLKINAWKNINQTSCIHKDRSFNQQYSPGSFSNVTCDCSFSQGTICHVTNIQLKRLNLTGNIPEEFGHLSQLQEIDLSGNYLNGAIPKSLSKIPLVNLALFANQISGPIPDEIGQITTLEKLDLVDNQISGVIPTSMGSLSSLKILVLSGNNITGTIPEKFANLKNLTELRMNGINLSGKIPNFIGNWTKLSILEMQGTSMEGPIPSSLSLLTSLKTLRISDLNTTSINFPNISSMNELKYLVLRNCFITDQIPEYIKTLESLKLIDLSYNQLSGPIPDSIGSLHDLEYLFLSNNLLSGALPGWIPAGTHHFDVSYNNFSGSIPVSCQQQSTNLNLVASYSSGDQSKPETQWCSVKDLPCPSPQYDSLFINCGGGKLSFQGNNYEEDSSDGGPSSYFANEQRWAYTSTGIFMYNEDGKFLAEDNTTTVTGIYITARLSPLSLKYYGLCLLQGNYTVRLHFAEIMFSEPTVGRRIFDVAIQGNVVLKDFNIAQEAQGIRSPIIKEFNNVTVNDNKLEISLYWAGKGTASVYDKNAYGPLISAIAVTPNSIKKGKGWPVGAIAGMVLASCVATVFVVVILIRMTCSLRGQDRGEEFRGLNTGYFTLRQIKAATNNFDIQNKIGEGGFGPVYKGVLSDGNVVAVKQLSSMSKQGNREFINEIGLISALQHPNLVKLHGCCIEGKELLLVYEYMENNSLAHVLSEKKMMLDWRMRKSICLGIARGLAYLHEESRLKIVHRDMKPANVLLDKDMTAKISDFGLARLDEEEYTHINTRIAGTVGYMAPEYATRGYLTDKADVYSFGVIILELVSGKINSNSRPKENSIHLLDLAFFLQEQGKLLELVDPSLGSNYSKEEASRLLNLALLCTNTSPTVRPVMSVVVSMIEGKLSLQAPIVNDNQRGMNKELRLKAFERLLHDGSQTHSSRSSQQKNTSSDAPWTGSSLSVQSKDESTQKNSPTARLLSHLADEKPE